MAAHDALDRDQADAGAGEVVGAVQPLEDAEQAVRVAHAEAGAVAGDDVHRTHERLRRELDSELQRLSDAVSGDTLTQVANRRRPSRPSASGCARPTATHPPAASRSR